MIQRIKKLGKIIINTLRHKPINAVIQVVKPQELLKGKIALITGGTSGIGLAIAKQFCEAGATVIITSRSKTRAEQTAQHISDTHAIGVEFDSCDIRHIRENLKKIKELCGGKEIDILVNNAGLVGGDIRNTTEEEYDKILATNLKGTFFLTKCIAEDMVSGGVKGNILNIASSSSLRPAVSAYILSKWGIRGLTEGMAKMLAPHGIVVNGLAPGPTATPMLGKNDYSDIALPTNPMGRYAVPEEIAAMALFLCGPQGRMIVGDIVYMTGGAGVIENNDINYVYTV